MTLRRFLRISRDLRKARFKRKRVVNQIEDDRMTVVHFFLLSILTMIIYAASALCQVQGRSVYFEKPYRIEPSTPNLQSYLMLKKQDSTGLIRVFAYNWRTRENKEVFYIMPPTSHGVRDLQVAPNGNACYTFGYGDNKLKGFTIVWDGEKSTTFYAEKLKGVYELDEYFLTPLLSPNGQKFVLYRNWYFGLKDSSAGIIFDQVFIASINVGESSYRVVRIDTLSVDGFHADASIERNLLTFSNKDSLGVYVNDHYPGQLYSETKSLWKLNLQDGSYTLIDPFVEEFLDVSLDDRLVLYTNNDQTCCGGSNYTNNLLILYDTKLKKRVKLFDEFKRYNNEGKEEDFPPRNGEFSPDNQWIAASVSNLIIALRTDGVEEKQYENRELMGWVDEIHLIVRERSHGALRVIDIETGKEEGLLNEQFDLLKIVWQ